MTDVAAQKPSFKKFVILQIVIIAAVLWTAQYLVSSGAYEKYFLQQDENAAKSEEAKKQADAFSSIEQSVSSMTTTIGDLTNRLNELEEENKKLKEDAEKQQKTAATTTDVEEVRASIMQASTRIGQVEAKVSSGLTNSSDRHFAMLSALWALQYRLNFGLPFQTDLRALKYFSKDIPEIADDLKDIEPFADSGIKTMSDLVDDFSITSENVQKIAGTYIPEKTWWQGFIINIGQVATVKKVGSETGSAEEVLRRSLQNLNHGDLSPAVSEIEKLPEVYSKSTEEWLKNAHARLAADDAISSIYERIIDSYEKSQGQKKN